jgi:hypothetical protein
VLGLANTLTAQIATIEPKVDCGICIGLPSLKGANHLGRSTGRPRAELKIRDSYEKSTGRVASSGVGGDRVAQQVPSELRDTKQVRGW